MAKRLHSPVRPKRSKLRQIARPHTLADPLVAQLTDNIVQLLKTSAEQDVIARAEVGHMLEQVRDRLPHGTWLRWLEQHVPFRERTARRAIELHDYSLQQPALFEKLAPLGVAKAYLLMTLPTKTTQRIVNNEHVIRSTGAHKTPAQMTFSELLEVVSNTSSTAPDSATQLVGGYRRQVRHLIRTLDALIDNRAHVDGSDLEDLHDDLLAASERFAAAFELDD